MTVDRKTWFRFSFAALLGLLVWTLFTYPQLSFIDLSVDKKAALRIAEDYLRQERGVDPSAYSHAVVFGGAGSADRYLQRSLGFEKEQEFLKRYSFDMFHWAVRFYREGEVEQHHVTVSASTGEIIGLNHTVEELAARPDITKEDAQTQAVRFLDKKFGFRLDENYIPSDSVTKKFENRVDHAFSWEHKDVNIPWSEEEGTGRAKLTTSIVVTGGEILSFSKHKLRIPEDYGLFISRKTNVGANLSMLFRYIFYALLALAMFTVLARRNDLAMHCAKPFYLGLTAFLFVIYLSSALNEFESVLYGYPTTTPFSSYLWRYLTGLIFGCFIGIVTVIMPSLAGESLSYEVFAGIKERGFLHYLRTSFFNREVAVSIGLGYLVAVIMIGLQSLAFAIGQKFLGVWVEYTWMAQLSTSYWPMLAALSVGVTASFPEEIGYRLFGMSVAKKYLKSTFLAVLVPAVLWGYSHSFYLVFPMWFRGLEVTCLGILLGWVYLRYGLITVITAHYLFDVFWGSAAYLLGKTTPGYFASALFVLLIPAGLAVAGHILNRNPEERPLRWLLNRHQLFNMGVLKTYLASSSPRLKGTEHEIQDIVAHGWDKAVVETAFEDIQKGRSDG